MLIKGLKKGGFLVACLKLNCIRMGQKFSSESIEKIRIKEPNFKILEANDVDITKYNKLRSVDIRRGRIVSISPSISDNILNAQKLISTLVKLNLSYNKLESLPKEFCLLINLKRLHLENNRLTVLPEEFPQLYRLEKLSLNNNKLKYLPANMKNLVHLKVNFFFYIYYIKTLNYLF